MPADVSKFDKIVVDLTMDDVDAEFLSGFFGENFKVDVDKKIVKILSVITDEEAVRFAKIKGLDFKVRKGDGVIKDFLKKISLKHPEIRYNLLKNVGEIEKLK